MFKKITLIWLIGAFVFTEVKKINILYWQELKIKRLNNKIDNFERQNIFKELQFLKQFEKVIKQANKNK